MGENCFTRAKNRFKLWGATDFPPATNKIFFVWNWLNFPALKISYSEAFGEEIKKQEEKGEAVKRPRGRAFGEHSIRLHRNSSGFHSLAVFLLRTGLQWVLNTPVLVKKINGVEENQPEKQSSDSKGWRGEATREDARL